MTRHRASGDSVNQLHLPNVLEPPYCNRGLFADHFLEDRLPELEEWLQTEGLHDAFNAVWRIYSEHAANLTPHTNERQTEHDFIEPVLNLLWREQREGDCYQVQSSISVPDARRWPDYAFFRTGNERSNAERRQGMLEYWRDVPVLGDAKRWSASLDRQRGADENPPTQICNYLYRSHVRWGILTNGRIWRLYEREKSSSGGIFYEVNLEDLLRSGDIEAFKYFYLFFRREAFLPDHEGKTFVERVFQGSVDYATEVGDRLKESVYDALRYLMNGFLAHSSNGLDASDPETVDSVHENCLIILYRLLFILYAEDRDLLPCEDEYYSTYSLRKLYQEVNDNLRAQHPYLPNATTLWGRLCNLFRLIDEGVKDGERVVIPDYNGGLFSLSNYPHIAHASQPDVRRWEIGDPYLAEAIDLLAYERDRWDEVGQSHVDYATLDVQHLGSIYEGLLELQPRLAEEPLIETLKGGKSLFKPGSEVPNLRPIHGQPPRTVEEDEVYLATDRGERKATGSYYTPKYIVQYIVENTIGPLADEAAKKVAALRSQVDKEIKKLERGKRQWERSSMSGAAEQIADLNRLIEKEKRRLLEPYLLLRILDPAMGSGHFLVGAADFMSLAMATDPNLVLLDEMDDEEPQAFYKRLVVERCLYGVDVNPLAVELAKLSLWLHTVSKDKSLSFLDHHLRCGNSLIGARIEDDLSQTPPELDARGRIKKRDTRQLVLGFTETLTATYLSYFLDTFRKIVETPTGDAEIERMKDRWYRDMDAVREKFRAVANCWLAPYFGVPVTPEQYERAVKALRGSNAEWLSFAEEKWFQDVQAAAHQKRFFHWELEFPEAFFDAHGFKSKEERGFDAVIGNPPWGGALDRSALDFLDATYTTVNDYEFYQYFSVISVLNLRRGGQHGFIVPNTYVLNVLANKFRKWMFEHGCFVELLDCSDVGLFADPSVRSIVYVYVNALSNQIIRVKKLLQPSRNQFLITDLTLAESKRLEDGNHWTSLLRSSLYKDDFLDVIKTASITLGEISRSKQGYIPYRLTTLSKRFGEMKARYIKEYREWHSEEKKGPSYQKELQGGDVRRYELLWSGRWVKYGPWVSSYVEKEYFTGPRLLFREISEKPPHRLLATFTEETFVHNPSILNACWVSKDYNALFALAVVNSAVISTYFFLTCPKSKKGLFPKILVEDVRHLPIRRISFTTLPDKRAQLLEEGKRLYKLCLLESDNTHFLEFVESQLTQTPERADVVHDLLAFLAEQMIEMNKQKQAEIKGFLTWLERHIGAEIDDLRNKTKLRAYHDYDFEALLDVLCQNRRKLKVNPDARNVGETIEGEFNQSIAKLTPLKAKIAATDRLIDLIVYQLYGLTEEEIAIVERTLSK